MYLCASTYFLSVVITMSEQVFPPAVAQRIIVKISKQKESLTC
jgi:hypothetical protein